MKSYFSASIAFIAACVPSLSNATTIYCQGSVVSVYVSEAGEVVFQPSYRADYTQVCSLSGSWEGVSTETCYAWYSQLIAAKTHSRDVLLQYSVTSQTCASLPTYGASLKPAYVMVQ